MLKVLKQELRDVPMSISFVSRFPQEEAVVFLNNPVVTARISGAAVRLVDHDVLCPDPLNVDSTSVVSEYWFITVANPIDSVFRSA